MNFQGSLRTLRVLLRNVCWFSKLLGGVRLAYWLTYALMGILS